MIRPDNELHQIPVSEWTPEERFSHLKRTFDQASIRHPDVMESYQILLADAEPHEEAEVMREALRSTFDSRHPRSLKPYQEGEDDSAR